MVCLKCIRHKTNSPNVPAGRPIASSVNIYDYQLAKYLCDLLQLHLSSDSFSFVQKLNMVGIFHTFIVSFGEVRVFANIPLKESIDLVVSYIAERNIGLNLSTTNPA